MDRPRRINWLLFALVCGVVLLALAGLALLGTYFYLSSRSTATAELIPPPLAVNAQAVAPDLAVLSLAGEPDDRIIRAALDAGETETAYAGLAYSTLLPESSRSGLWLLLANRFQQGDLQRADFAYQAALDLAALGPALSDAARVDISLQAARGYRALDMPWAARLALAQAENIARHSLSLLPAQRRSALQQVITEYRALPDSRAAQALQDELESLTSGPGVVAEQGAQVLPTLRGSIVLPSRIAAAMLARQQAAAKMAANWFSTAPSGRQALAEEVGNALLEEDRLRSEFYGSGDQLELPDRLALLHDQVAWLAVKYRVAQGAYGVSLVPTWEEQAEEIRAALAEAYTSLINGYGQLLDTLGPAEAAEARVELLRQGVLWTRLGLFPDHAEETLSQQLSDATRELWTRQGGAGLTIVEQDDRGRRFYLLSGSDTAQPRAVGLRVRTPSP